MYLVKIENKSHLSIEAAMPEASELFSEMLYLLKNDKEDYESELISTGISGNKDAAFVETDEESWYYLIVSKLEEVKKTIKIGINNQEEFKRAFNIEALNKKIEDFENLFLA